MAGSEFRSLEQGTKALTQLGKDLHKTPAQMAASTGRVYTAAIKSSIDSVTSGGKLRGVGKYNGGARTGARVGVRQLPPLTNAQGASVIIQATGPLHLIERDNRDHTVPRTQGSRRRRTAAGRLSHQREATGTVLSGRTPMLINGEWRTGPWTVKGSKGKHPFARGVLAGQNAARVQAITAISNELGKLFR